MDLSLIGKKAKKITWLGRFSFPALSLGWDAFLEFRLVNWIDCRDLVICQNSFFKSTHLISRISLLLGPYRSIYRPLIACIRQGSLKNDAKRRRYRRTEYVNEKARPRNSPGSKDPIEALECTSIDVLPI